MVWTPFFKLVSTTQHTFELEETRCTMWSVEVNGRHSAFSAQQRLLFPVRDSSERTKKCLLRALQHGTSTGVAVLNPDDRSSLQLVRHVVQTVHINSLHHTQFSIAVTTCATWTAGTLSDRIHDVLGHLQIEKLTALLLSRPRTLATGDIVTTSERKRAILEYWEAMCGVLQRGLVEQIGISDFPIQEMEFLFAAFPRQPPTGLSIQLALAPTRRAPAATAHPPFRSMLSFAHSHHMDVLVRFAYRSLEEIPRQVTLRDQWLQIVERAAQHHRAMHFDVLAVHESEKESYHTEKRDLSETTALQTSQQIILRYFIQKGCIVVPLPDSEVDGSEQFADEDIHAIFYMLAHPFSSLSPVASPETPYSSILSNEILRLMDQVLPLVAVLT